MKTLLMAGLSLIALIGNLSAQGSGEFFVADVFSEHLESIPDVSTQIWKYPGVANSSCSIPAGSTVTVFLQESLLDVVVLNIGTADPFPSSQGMNLDAVLGIYDVSTNPPTFKQVIPFTGAYGMASNGQAFHATVQGSGSMSSACSHAGSHLGPFVQGDEVTYGMALPLSWGSGPFKVGVALAYNLAHHGLFVYVYNCKGRIKYQ